MLFDLSKAYKHFDSDVRFAELTEDDVELNKAYEFTTKNSPTSATIQNLINIAVKMLEKGKGTRGETLWRGDARGKWNVLYRLIYDKYHVDVEVSASPKWSLPKEEVDKKVRFLDNWREKVYDVYYKAVKKRREELGK